MTRNGDLEPILQPWMERNAPPAPDDLLPRVIREVESMSQRTGLWSSFFATSHVPALTAVAVAVMALAVATGAYFLSTASSPVGGDTSPTPAASASPGPSTNLELVDAVLAAWNAHDGDAALRLYTADAQLRLSVGWPGWTETYTDPTQISATVTDRAAMHFTVERTSIVSESNWNNGGLLAHPIRYESGAGSGYGFAIYRHSGMTIQYQWIVALSGTPPASAGRASTELTGFFSQVLAAWSSGNGELAASFYTTGPDPLNSGDVRLAIGGSDFSEEYVGHDEIAANATIRKDYDFVVRSMGTPTAYGDLFLLPAYWSSVEGTGDLMLVFQLNPEHTKIIHQWGFGS